MALDIRTITIDEFEQASLISSQAFGNNNRANQPQAVEQMKRFYQPDWHLAAFEDGEMASMMRILPFAMRINGRAIPFGAVSPVANSPLHRRKGYTGAMLRESLRVMRERGQWLSGLYTPHPAFYRRYGWEIACDERQYVFKPKDSRLAADPSERGRLRWVLPADWSELDRVYRPWSTGRNGPLHRGEVWWRNSIMGEANTGPDAQPSDAVVWDDGAGQPQGYVVFVMPNRGLDAGKVITRQLAANTADAYLNLMIFLGQHDIHSEIQIWAPSDDPLPLLFADTDRLKIEQHYTVMLRLVDVEAALRARPLADPECDAAFTLRVHDASAPWNDGTYGIGAKDGAPVIERLTGDADLEVEAKWLAPIFNGYISPTAAASAGLLRAPNAAALSQADAFFAATHRPYFPDRF